MVGPDKQFLVAISLAIITIVIVVTIRKITLRLLLKG